jgi:hypothetical protein
MKAFLSEKSALISRIYKKMKILLEYLKIVPLKKFTPKCLWYHEMLFALSVK